MPAGILDSLTNREVIGVDQDAAGHQGRRLSQSGDGEIRVRELSGGAKAVGLFNRGAESAMIAS
jgi:alpha-galactosidase